jgi:hypothetical protein
MVGLMSRKQQEFLNLQ